MDKPEFNAGLRGRDLVIAAGLVLLAALLRWYNLANWDMWTDEVQTLWTAMSGDFIRQVNLNDIWLFFEFNNRNNRVHPFVFDIFII